jgi:putative lipoic acid-binding regulatory protein
LILSNAAPRIIARHERADARRFIHTRMSFSSRYSSILVTINLVNETPIRA